MTLLLALLHESPAPHVHADGIPIYSLALAAAILSASLGIYLFARSRRRRAQESSER